METQFLFKYKTQNTKIIQWYGIQFVKQIAHEISRDLSTKRGELRYIDKYYLFYLFIFILFYSIREWAHENNTQLILIN